MCGEFAVTESFAKGASQVATEKTFLPRARARAIEIAERRNTEHGAGWGLQGERRLAEAGRRGSRRRAGPASRHFVSDCDSYVCCPRIKVRLLTVSRSLVVASRRASVVR